MASIWNSGTAPADVHRSITVFEKLEFKMTYSTTVVVVVISESAVLKKLFCTDSSINPLRVVDVCGAYNDVR